MARIEPVEMANAAPRARELLDRYAAAGGRITNMKRTLAHSPLALELCLRWYDLRAEVAAFLGERLTTLFTHAISRQTDCLVCSTFFRYGLAQSGEDPDNLRLGVWEQAVVEFGRQLARDANGVSDVLYDAIGQSLAPAQCVTLTAFGSLMIAINVFNNALRVDLDEYLFPFKKDP